MMASNSEIDPAIEAEQDVGGGYFYFFIILLW